ncbi:MAG: hypothetical protein IJZ44_02150 [Lachnospiraceae bacterium]|nr:hypothetical protein [Lachnospiraceae bacterium]
MSNIIKIEDGCKTYDIVNEKGDVLGHFSFNPSDVDIVNRHAEVVDELNRLKAELSNNTKEKGVSETLKEVNAIVYEKVNYLFNADVANVFFSIMGPFSPLASGKFFVEEVIDAIGQAIQAETGARVKRIKEKVRKATAKYHK